MGDRSSFSRKIPNWRTGRVYLCLHAHCCCLSLATNRLSDSWALLLSPRLHASDVSRACLCSNHIFQWQNDKHGNDLLSLILCLILFYPVKSLKMRYINFVAFIQTKCHLHIYCVYTGKTSAMKFTSNGKYLYLQ